MAARVARRRTFGTRKQGAQQTKPAQLAHRRHAREAVGATVPRLPQRDGLRLIVQMVGEQQVQRPCGPAPRAEQGVTRFPGGGLDAGCGLGPGPGQDAMRDPAPAQPRADLPGLRGRARAQAVIDDQCGHLAAPRPRPVVGEQAQAQAVRAARDRDRQARPPLERTERADQRLELGRSQRLRQGRLRRSRRGCAPGPWLAGCALARWETPWRARHRSGRPCRSPEGRPATCRA